MSTVSTNLYQRRLSVVKLKTVSEINHKKQNKELSAVHPLKIALEAGPVIAFLFTYFYIDIFWATATFMVTTVIALTISRTFFGYVPVLPLISGILVVIFGGLTLVYQEEIFIKIKPTICNLLFASILFGGLIMRSFLIKYILGEVYKLQDEGWQKLSLRWAYFFVFLAILNEIIWRNFSTEFWSSFKLWGVMPITAIFAISQMSLLKKYSLPAYDNNS